METREELEKYLNENLDTELPFLEELWDKCVQICKDNEGNHQQYLEKIITKSDGTKTIKKQGISNVIINPTQQYFKMANLVQYKKKALAQFDEIESESDLTSTQMANIEELFGGSNVSANDEIISWIRLFKPNECEYLMKRYSSYFDQYEINEGADKTSLKRILSLEIALFRIDLKRADGRTVDVTDEKKLTELLQSTFESLKWTKKQRSARDDMAQNKFTVWMDKQVQNGEFASEKQTYEKDEIDFLLDTIIESTRETLM